MTTYLLDANVLIALTVQEHEHHDRAAAWASEASSYALCPSVEGALIRFFVRMGESPAVATAVLHAVRTRPGGEFWPDALSYVDVDLSGVRGHRQVTDAYLAGLARSHPDALLATMDEGLNLSAPNGSFFVPAL